MSIENYRSQNHMLILYEEDESHRNALKKIMVSYDYAGILHNKDIDENGELKKPHYHIVIRFSNAKWRTALAKELGIEPNYIQDVRKFDNALLYLIHYNDTDKAQYDISELFGNMKTRIKEIINKLEKSEGEKVVELIEYIQNYSGRITVTQFAQYCAKNGYWSEFRRSGSIFCKMIEEKNEIYKIKEYPRE